MKNAAPSIEEEIILECEKFRTFILMIAVGGFLGAYTYTLKGGVFCNAQTANFVMLAVQLGEGNWSRALYFLIPISAYLLGAVLSEFLPRRVNRLGILRWDTVFVAFEMVCLFAIALIPDAAPQQICQVWVNFIASMQYNTFRQAKKVPMATTFCTNHIRQIGVNLVKWLHKKNEDAKERLIMHVIMLIAFVTAGVAATFLGSFFGGKAIWFAEILLAVVLIDFILADRGREKDKLDVVPHGH